MQKRISNLPFQGTAEQEAKLKEIIARHKDQPGAIMPCLQEAQEVYGYLPVEVQTMIAEGLGVSLEEVFGVSTFYSQFSLTPKGKYNVSICLGTACYVKGAAAVLDVKAGYYECPSCHAVFVPTMAQYVKGLHTLTRRRLTCPDCGKTSMCRHRIVR